MPTLSVAASEPPPESPPDRPSRGRARTAILCALLAAAIAVFAGVANQHYPLRAWLLFMYVPYWLYALLFSAACLSAGLRALAMLLPEPPRLGEKLTLGFALGVLIFASGVFLGGLAGLFGHVFFFAWPACMLAVGVRPTWRNARRARQHLRRFGMRLLLPRGLVEGAAAVLLALGLVAVYLLVMTPLNVGGDSYWYHLPIAEEYVARGAIRPFAEGWYLGAYPQLASLLYTWAFQAPGDLFDHVMLSSHVEWALFLATLPGISVLARRLLGGTRVPYAAAALFLFPGFLLYDSSLVTGADHIHAFWAPALGIALLRLGRRFEAREAVLAGILTAGPILTKYQGLYFFVCASLLVLFLGVRTRRVRPVLLWALACLVTSSSHWLKNWVWYADPLYPLLHKVFPSRPFHAGAAPLLDREYWNAQFVLTGTFWEKVWATALSLPTFSFVVHDWNFHGERPVFGSLFTLLIPVLFFVRPRPRARVWMMIVGIHVAIAVWFATSHQDRFLQAVLPWMVACSVTALVLAWRAGAWVRTGIVVLVLFQVAWGADIYFIRSHAMIGDSVLKETVNFLGAGQAGRYDERRHLHGGSFQPVGERLPEHAKVLVHERHDRLGLLHESVSDTVGWQGAIDYLLLETPDATVDFWRKLGVTHAVWWPDAGGMSPEQLAREAGFARTIDQWSSSSEDVGDRRLSTLGSQARDAAQATRPTRIAWLGCGGDPATGVYSPAGLGERTPEKRLADDAVRSAVLTEIAEANALVLRPACGYLAGVEGQVNQQFKMMVKVGDVGLWVRR